MDQFDLLLTAITCDSNLLAPVNLLDPKAMTAIDTVKAMLTALEETRGPLLDFLHEYLVYHVDVFGTIDTDGRLTSDKTRRMSDGLKGFTHSDAAVYTLTQAAAPGDLYIGSTVDFGGRMKEHRNTLSSGQGYEGIHKRLTVIGVWGIISMAEIYRTVNYTRLATKLMPNHLFSMGEIEILRALTQLITRLLEQSLITKLCPTLQGNAVTYQYNHWDKRRLTMPYYPHNRKAVIIRAHDTGQVLAVAYTIGNAATTLGVSITTVGHYLNDSKGFNSPGLKAWVTASTLMTDLYDKQHPASSNTLSRVEAYGYVSLPQGRLTDLNLNAVWAVTPDKTGFLGPYSSFADATRSLYPDMIAAGGGIGHTVGRACNANYLLSTDLGQFYIVCNPDCMPKKHPFNKASIPKSPFPDSATELHTHPPLICGGYYRAW